MQHHSQASGTGGLAGATDLWNSLEMPATDDYLMSRWIFRTHFLPWHNKSNDHICCLIPPQQPKPRQVGALPCGKFWNPARPLGKRMASFLMYQCVFLEAAILWEVNYSVHSLGSPHAPSHASRCFTLGHIFKGIS